MSDSLIQDKNFVFGVVAASAALIAALSYVIFGPESWRERGSKCTGLINLGNTCFVNAVIQGMSALTPVHQWLDHCKTHCSGKLTLGLRSLLNDMDTGAKLEVSPRQVLDGLRWHGWILDHQQQDACELYNILLSTIDEELVGSQTSLSELQGLLQQDHAQTGNSSTVLTRLGRTLSPMKVPSCPLRGLLVSSLTCCRCRQSLPTKYEYFDCLSISLKDQFVRQVSLESCLRSYMSAEVVTDVECTHCSKASNGVERRNFKKKLLIGRPPLCLSIHVVRTLWQNDGSISKNNTHLVFPLSLNVSQFMDNSDQSSRLYRLRAVIEHIGGPHSGHYCTYRCHGNQWVYTSDSTVYRTSVHEVQQCQAYMLFYERIV